MLYFSFFPIKKIAEFSSLRFSPQFFSSLAGPRGEWAASPTPSFFLLLLLLLLHLLGVPGAPAEHPLPPLDAPGGLPQLLLHADGQPQIEPRLLHIGLQEPEQLETAPGLGSGEAGGEQEQEQEQEQGRQVEQGHPHDLVRRVGSFKVGLQSITGRGPGKLSFIGLYSF